MVRGHLEASTYLYSNAQPEGIQVDGSRSEEEASVDEVTLPLDRSKRVKIKRAMSHGSNKQTASGPQGTEKNPIVIKV